MRKFTNPIFFPLFSRMCVTFPSPSGALVSLSITLDISQGNVVFSTSSAKQSTPKSVLKVRTYFKIPCYVQTLVLKWYKNLNDHKYFTYQNHDFHIQHMRYLRG